MKLFYKIFLFAFIVGMGGVFGYALLKPSFVFADASAAVCIYEGTTVSNPPECVVLDSNEDYSIVSNTDKPCENILFNKDLHADDPLKEMCKNGIIIQGLSLKDYKATDEEEKISNAICLEDGYKKVNDNKVNGGVFELNAQAGVGVTNYEKKDCPNISGYNLVKILQHPFNSNSDYNIAKKHETNDFSSKKTALGDKAQQQIDAQNAQKLDLLNALKVVVPKNCCVPLDPNTKSNNTCVKPTIKKEIELALSPSQTLTQTTKVTDVINILDAVTKGKAGSETILDCMGGVTQGNSVYKLYPVSCNDKSVGKAIQPPSNKWVNQGTGITWSMYAMCYGTLSPHQVRYCACSGDKSECNSIALESVQKCDDFIKSKAGWQCIDIELKAACESYELITSADGTKKCPDAGTGKTTDQCAHLVVKKGPAEIPPAEQVDIANLAKGLNKLQDTTVQTLIGRIIKTAMGIMGSIALAMFVYSGFLYMMGTTSVTGGASKQDVIKAKSIMVWTSLGILVIFASYALVDLVFEIFR